jgi:uncharacterized membrane-anchored protein
VSAIRLPPDHPQRFKLHNEIHSRPPEAIVTPSRLSYLALFSPPSQREEEWLRVCDLARKYDAAPPPAGASHYSRDFGPFRLKWERHTEFARYTFIAKGVDQTDPFENPPIALVPEEWLANLPGELIDAFHVVVFRADTILGHEEISHRFFHGEGLIGSAVGAGAARAYTDVRIQSDRFSKLLIQDLNMSPRQCGRMVQRILEIETYRIMALFALPVAQESSIAQAQYERESAQITQALANSTENDEAGLLERLTRLEAQIESRISENHYRFSAADAYYDLVRQRIAHLREERIEGLQTFQEFIERRLAPAMSTCRSIAARQDSLSDRVARATQLLSTRVDLTRERQNQSLLESMDRRAALQLRLQSTVEGLSVAAITYYLVGLVGYLGKGFKAQGLPINVDVVTGASIPVIALLTAWGIRRVRKVVAHHSKP